MITMPRALITTLLIAAGVVACKPEWPREDPIGGKPSSTMTCDAGPSGRFVISADSVGPFAMATATMDDIVSSCGAVSTEYESTCCGMAVLARFDYPGVHVAAEQESRDTMPRPLSRIVKWDVAGDSIYLESIGLLPRNVAQLAEKLGRGWVEVPEGPGADGPMARFCAVATIMFRVAPPGDAPRRKWPADTAALNRQVRVVGVVIDPKLATPDCGPH